MKAIEKQSPIATSEIRVIGKNDQNFELMKIAVQADGGVEKLEKLMNLQERWESAEARRAFFAAMAGYQDAVPVIVKNGLASFPHKTGGGKTEYKYAKLEDIAKAIQKPLADHGLSYRFEQKTEPGSSGPFITVKCIVSHRDGHFETASMSGYGDSSGSKNAIQQLASTVSYLRRYTLTGALGITTTDFDNDGADAGENDRPAANGFYPQESFDKSFGSWETQINSGNKTAQQITDYLQGKGANLNLEQYNKIHGIGA